MCEKSLFRSLPAAALAATLLATTAQAQTTMETVPVGNPGNADDTHGDGYGGVAYRYNIGTCEVTAGQYRDSLNAVDATGVNPNGVYNALMNMSPLGCQITWNAGASTYDFSGGAAEAPGSTEADWENRPVNYVSWYDAARFANWLTSGGTEDGVYKFSGGVLQSIMDHQAAGAAYGTAYFIPTEDEWYKAAYYDPTDYDPDGPGGVDPGAGYWDYPTQSDAPNVPSNDLVEPADPGNNATFYDDGDTIGSPYYRTGVGAHEDSESAYGTFDQGGNIWEWNETPIGSSCGVRGGSWGLNSYTLHASNRYPYNPSDEFLNIGFRVAGIPEPGSSTLLLCGLVTGLMWWRRRK